MIHLNHWHSVNPDLKFSDVIDPKFKVSKTSSGITVIKFKTGEKYVDVDVSSQRFKNGKWFTSISIIPYINCKSLDDCESEEKFKAFMNHPDYYSAEILVESGSSRISYVTPLKKHEYHIAIIPLDLILIGDDPETILIGE